MDAALLGRLRETIGALQLEGRSGATLMAGADRPLHAAIQPGGATMAAYAWQVLGLPSGSRRRSARIWNT
jgi:urease accessory protein